MHIIVPMSGVGKRFMDVGYKTPKPLIEIDNMPIIEHVCNLFPDEDKFTFICNSKHLKETEMRDVLKRIKPNCQIVEIPCHKKGPVYAVSLLENIDDDEEVIINYCDFGTYWDYKDFLKHTRDRDADAAIPSYRGFHPHMLGDTNYAFMKEDKQWMLEIKEKEPFTNNRMQEYASNGTYYFKKGSTVKKYFKKLMDKQIDLNGEFYVSLVNNLLVQDDLKVSIYEIQHMLQWGTPEDVYQYNVWSNYFSNAISEQEKFEIDSNTVTLIPLAGHGSRFKKNGYIDPKPLLDVSGKPMIIQAAKSLPQSKEYRFIALAEHLRDFPLEEHLIAEYPSCKVIAIEGVTEGQAITCDRGLEDNDAESSLLIAATDNGMIYDHKIFKEQKEYKDTDIIIFTFRGHISSKTKPEMYGWVDINEQNCATNISVKKQTSDNPFEDHAIVGTFWFRSIDLFKYGLKKIIDNNVRINNEFYVDSLVGALIDEGFNARVLEVQDYICWGTPEDYETFIYWQSYFHKTPTHPYSLEKDITVNPNQIDSLNEKYKKFSQKYN